MGFTRQEYWNGLPLPSPSLSIKVTNSRNFFQVGSGSDCRPCSSSAAYFFSGTHSTVLKLILPNSFLCLDLQHLVIFYQLKYNRYSVFYLIFIYLFMSVLGLHCCVQAFSSCGKGGSSLVAVRGILLLAVCRLLTAVASLCCSTRALGHAGFSSCALWIPEHGLSTCDALA